MRLCNEVQSAGKKMEFTLLGRKKWIVGIELMGLFVVDNIW